MGLYVSGRQELCHMIVFMVCLKVSNLSVGLRGLFGFAVCFLEVEVNFFECWFCGAELTFKAILIQ